MRVASEVYARAVGGLDAPRGCIVEGTVGARRWCEPELWARITLSSVEFPVPTPRGRASAHHASEDVAVRERRVVLLAADHELV